MIQLRIEAQFKAQTMPGDDRNRLESEIAVIQELLDEQPDSKCKGGVAAVHNIDSFLLIGCMESIVHYNTILVDRHGSFVDGPALRDRCYELLQQLIQLDPARKNRYLDKRQ